MGVGVLVVRKWDGPREWERRSNILAEGQTKRDFKTPFQGWIMMSTKIQIRSTFLVYFHVLPSDRGFFVDNLVLLDLFVVLLLSFPSRINGEWMDSWEYVPSMFGNEMEQIRCFDWACSHRYQLPNNSCCSTREATSNQLDGILS